MTLGEKIKKARKEKKITQASIAGEVITRNMLSYIESGAANPSLETLKHIATALDLPLGYLLSDSDDLFTYKKNEKIGLIRKLFEEKRYPAVISLCEELGDADDEIAFIMTASATNYGRTLMKNGSLNTAKEALNKAKEYARKTVYPTEIYENIIPMYLAVCENIQAPLLEFDTDAYFKGMVENEDYEFYKYLTLDYDFDYTTDEYARHLKAKKLMKQRNYLGAIEIMKDISENKNYGDYNAHLMFCLYADIEASAKQLLDFETAYKYSSKRLSLIESFKS
ncbi:MAG: helix-turn-helix transcriptional regulator [Clostridia bacterium]|nr:helix-turn-helix transcriptional regulator [Clostridia bacterium]